MFKFKVRNLKNKFIVRIFGDLHFLDEGTGEVKMMGLASKLFLSDNVVEFLEDLCKDRVNNGYGGFSEYDLMLKLDFVIQRNIFDERNADCFLTFRIYCSEIRYIKVLKLNKGKVFDYLSIFDYMGVITNLLKDNKKEFFLFLSNVDYRNRRLSSPVK